MSVRIELGRIKSATYGFGGYQDVEFGFSVTLGGESWSVGDFTNGVSGGVERLRDVLKAAKKIEVGQLVGTPVEVTFDGTVLESWRVLTEVL